MIVQDIMTAVPLSVEVTERLAAARAKLFEADVRHLPVVDRGRLVGIISERDLPSDLVDPTARGGADRADRPISAFMSSDVLSVSPESELDEAIDLMIEHRIGAVPVVDADGDRLVGIVSYVDVLREMRGKL
jgi:acetoin utilization protein AcuB